MVVAHIYVRLRNRNPVPSQGRGAGKRRWKNIPKRGTLADPLSEAPTASYLHQMADLVAHALLKQEEEPSATAKRLGIARAFGILDRAPQPQGTQARPPGRREAVTRGV